MIGYLKGSVISKGINFVLLNVNNVGYKVWTSSGVKQDEEVEFYTHLVVREDALDLYGFATKDELALFESLIGVSGVGPKTALSILSINTAPMIAEAVSQGKPQLITGPGVGKKTAERIVLELSGKLPVSGSGSDLYEALIGLGYTPIEAKTASSQAKGVKIEDQIKEALKELKK